MHVHMYVYIYIFICNYIGVCVYIYIYIYICFRRAPAADDVLFEGMAPLTGKGAMTLPASAAAACRCVGLYA